MSDSAAENLKRKLEADLRAAEEDRDTFLAKLAEIASAGDVAPPGQEIALAGRTEAAEPPILTVLRDKSQPVQTRLEAMAHLGLPVAGFDETVEALLAIVEDSADDGTIRFAALRILGSAAFQVVRFRPHEQAYQRALRNLVDDAEPRLRDVAVEILALRHDPEVQQVLVAGLERTRPLPVERARAIQLLADDEHLDNLPWLQELYESGVEDARQEAVRLMGSYPAATEQLESILRDKSEAVAVRQRSVASLRNLAPDRFEAVANDIAADSGDDPDIRAMSAHALQHLGAGGLAEPA